MGKIFLTYYVHTKVYPKGEISSSHGGECEVWSLLGLTTRQYIPEESKLHMYPKVSRLAARNENGK
jgi:hypothetical protein